MTHAEFNMRTRVQIATRYLSRTFSSAKIIFTQIYEDLTKVNQAPVVQKMDSAIHWINLYPVDNAIGFPNTYPLDSDLSSG